MFQRSMSCPIGTKPKEDLVVGILSNSFSSMEKLGDEVMKPFLQVSIHYLGIKEKRPFCLDAFIPFL